MQDGDEGRVFMGQIGYSNSSTITQNVGGSYDGAGVYQTGDGVIFAVAQSNADQTAIVIQTGMMNESVLTKGGTGDYSTTTQSSGSSIAVTQGPSAS